MRYAARLLAIAAIASIIPAIEASAQTPAFDPTPWLKDLDVVERAMATRYANLDWLVFTREMKPAKLFEETRDRIKRASNASDAREAFGRLASRMGDGHVTFDWPKGSTGSAPPIGDTCAKLGYDVGYNGAAIGQAMAGYRPLSDDIDANLPAGTVRVGKTMVGIVRIGMFGPQASPGACKRALKDLNIAPQASCDDACAEKVETRAYAILTDDLEKRLRALQRSGATALLLDITGNGGGSEWAEAVARMLTLQRIRSARLGFVRTSEWADQWSSLAGDLRKAAQNDAESRTQLLRWAEKADLAKRDAQTPCTSDNFLQGEHPKCAWLANGGYATGLLADADVAKLKGKPWATLVYSPMKYNFTPGVWRGPLVVAVDEETWSAAEEVAAVLQDNRAAIIVGSPTGGAGCGHASGAAPTALPNTNGTLKLPNCARFRADGSNEVAAVIPDVFTGFRRQDGPQVKARKLAAALPQALAKAAALR